jgi:prophage DNA circulation protein
MIKKRDMNDAVAGATTVINALMATLGGSTGVAGTSLTWSCGQILADLQDEFTTGAFWPDLANCFELARTAGATYAEIDLVRTTAAALTPISPIGIAVQNYSIRMSLVELAQILAATTFVSRDDIDAALDTINAAFCSAEDTAAGAFDTVSYQALISLHAAVAQDLSNREQTLPRIIYYNFQRPLSALYLAQRIYQDASRAGEMVLENQVPNPLFMPLSIRALSA